MGMRLTEVSLAMGLAADERQLSAAQAAAGFELERSAQAIASRQVELTFALGLLNNQTTMALGQGRLALDNLALNASFAEAMVGLRIDAASLIQALQLAATGQNAEAIQIFLDIFEQLRLGHA